MNTTSTTAERSARPSDGREFYGLPFEAGPARRITDTGRTRPDGLEELLNEPAYDGAMISLRLGGRQIEIRRAHTYRDRDDSKHDPVDVKDEAGAEAGAAKRDVITRFSEASRRRLLRLFHSLRRSQDVLMVTLTYHETRPTPERCKRDLDAFLKRLNRLLEGRQVGAIWRMEPQERGVPHFHLLMYGIRYLDAQMLSREWHEVTAETSEQHRKSGVDVERIQSPEQAAAYCSEYLAKVEDGEWPEAGGPEWKRPGRFWGVFRRGALRVAAWDGHWSIPSVAADWLIGTLLDEWDVDIPPDVLPPRLTINTRGSPGDRLRSLLKRIEAEGFR